MVSVAGGLRPCIMGKKELGEVKLSVHVEGEAWARTPAMEVSASATTAGSRGVRGVAVAVDDS